MPMKSILTQLEEQGEVALSRAGKEKGREGGEIQLEMTVFSLFPTFCLSHHIRRALASLARGKKNRLNINFATSSYSFAGFVSLLHVCLAHCHCSPAFFFFQAQLQYNCWYHCKTIVQLVKSMHGSLAGCLNKVVACFRAIELFKDQLSILQAKIVKGFFLQSFSSTVSTHWHS